jgi:glycosyltransferase involved in cell wall biosynthesis
LGYINQVKKVSLVVPILNEESTLKRGLKELESFIQRFPLAWELILIVDPSSDASLNLARELKSEKIEVKVIANSKHLGRGPSVLSGLRQATGDYMMIFPLDFTIPLADLFNFLQELILNPTTDMAIGNRNTSRKKREAPRRTSWHWTLDNIILEKWRKQGIASSDPLCPFLVFQKSALEKLLPSLKMKHWYYTPEILRHAHQLNLKITEIPILSRDSQPSRIPIVREYLRNLF